MEKRTIILNLSSELVDKIDQLNTMKDRSDFISSLLEKQLDVSLSNNRDETNKLITKMSEKQDFLGISGEIDLINSEGISIGKFDIDTLEGFENLAKKIQEISKDPAVQIRAKSFF
jgi:hypothetical protein